MAEPWNILSVVFFLLAGVLGVAALVLWLKFDIHKILGELGARSAKRRVKRIREANEQAEGDATMQLENIMIIHTDEVLQKEEEEI